MNRRMGPPPGFGPGGPGGPMGQERKLVKQFDKDADGRLNRDERLAGPRVDQEGTRAGGGPAAARLRPARRLRPRGTSRRRQARPSHSSRATRTFPGKPLYDPTVIRTLFLDFPDKDWEAEIADFYRTDVEVPATLTVDGKNYPNVGVHFRGHSSFFGCARAASGR